MQYKCFVNQCILQSCIPSSLLEVKSAWHLKPLNEILHVKIMVAMQHLFWKLNENIVGTRVTIFDLCTSRAQRGWQSNMVTTNHLPKLYDNHGPNIV